MLETERTINFPPTQALWLFTTPAISSHIIKTDRICVQVTVEV